MVARTSIVLLVLVLASSSTQWAIAGGEPSATTSSPLIAFMRVNPSSMQVRSRVFLMNVNGRERRALTARPVYGGVGYAPYSWSPDRRYLLLPVPAPRGAATLWLFDRAGRLVRKLGSVAAAGIFHPSWAIDVDEIIFVNAMQSAGKRSPNFIWTVDRMDLSGRRSPIFRFSAFPPQCGGFGASMAEDLYENQLSGFGFSAGVSWSEALHRVVFGLPCGGLFSTDTSTGVTRMLGPKPGALGGWAEGALSAAGVVVVAAPVGRIPPDTIRYRILLADPRTGAVLRRLPSGELPTWGPDGRTLYFVQRTIQTFYPTPVSTMSAARIPAFWSYVMRWDGTNGRVTRLTVENAYALGPINAPPGGTLVYSRIDNLSRLHRAGISAGILPDTATHRRLLWRYGPRVNVERLDPGGKPVVIVRDAGLPA